MRFTLEINMDTVAFADNPMGEIRDILDGMRLYADQSQQILRDSNGNTVGEWKIAQ